MPILVALLVAIVVSAVAFGIAARRSRATDVADVRVNPHTSDAAIASKQSALRQFLRQRGDPTTETGILLTIAVAGVAAAILIIGALLELISKHAGFARLDDSAARFGARHATPDTTTLLKVVTSFGSTPVIAGIVVVVGVQQYVQHRKKAAPLFLVAAVVSAVAVGNLVKVIVHRARPDVARLVGAYGSSFPSGHSTAAAATYAALALLFGRHRSRKVQATLAAAAGSIAIAVAASRVLLGVHWLTDVIAGLLLGWTCFALCSMAFGGRILRFGQPVEAANESAPGPRRV
ncbi:MAG: phosphatase PAP2 family protein [Ilumatobacteraceae bacterium]